MVTALAHSLISELFVVQRKTKGMLSVLWQLSLKASSVTLSLDKVWR